MKRIAIVGLGIMGQGMADNFLRHKYEVVVWNRTKSISHKFKKKGAIVADSPKEATEMADIVFEITANDKSSKAVWLGQKSILAGASKDKVLIASATLSIKWTDELIKLCRKSRFQFMDVPLTGGRVGAESGNLTLLVGGSKKLVKKLTPIFKAIAGNIFHFGPEGHGMRYKLLLNFVQASHIISFGQAMRIAKKNRMDLKRVADGLAFRPGGVITEIARNAYFNDPSPITFSVEWITKDLSYANEFASGVDTKLLEEVLGEYKKAMNKGYAKKDWASVNKLV